MPSGRACLLLQLFEADALRGSMLIHDGQRRPAHQRHKAPAHLQGKRRQLMRESSLPFRTEGLHRASSAIARALWQPQRLPMLARRAGACIVLLSHTDQQASGQEFRAAAPYLSSSCTPAAESAGLPAPPCTLCPLYFCSMRTVGHPLTRSLSRLNGLFSPLLQPAAM